MKCPFLISKDMAFDLFDNHSKGHILITEKFGNCSYDECPFYYKDDEDVDHCSRCDGGPEEDL